MKRLFGWQFFLGSSLVLLSALLYFVHYLIFHDAHHIFIYLLGDIAFVFIEVLLVVLIIHRVLDRREKRAMLQKLNMVIGAFFIEEGTRLLGLLSSFDPDAAETAKKLVITDGWSDRDFLKMHKDLKKYVCDINITSEDFGKLKDLLLDKRDFLLRLLENSNLLENESFADLLWAVSHLTEELSHRKGLERLAESDLRHITGDIKRVYERLISEWIDYMKHLKDSYPYLFSLAMRTNPFDENASVEVR